VSDANWDGRAKNWSITRWFTTGIRRRRCVTVADETSGTVATLRLPPTDAHQSVDEAVRPQTTLFQWARLDVRRPPVAVTTRRERRSVRIDRAPGGRG
jgi:hypothetical protein